MAYQSNIPQATDQLSVSQGDIQGNFAVLGAIGGNANIASAALNGTAGFNFVMFPLPDAVLPTFPTGQEALYNKTFAFTGYSVNELTVHKIAQGSGGPTTSNIPLTASSASNTFYDFGPLNNAFGARGWTYLPSGILLKFAQVSNTTTPFDLNTFGPNFTAIFGVQLTNANTGNLGNFAVAQSGFTASITVTSNAPTPWFANILAYGIGAGA